MKRLTPILIAAALAFAGQATAQDAKADAAADKRWTERVVGGWRVESRATTKEGEARTERSDINFGSDGRFSATTVVDDLVEPVKLQSSGTYKVTSIDATRARIVFTHQSTDPLVRKDELTETVEVTSKDKSALVFPDNAILKPIR